MDAVAFRFRHYFLRPQRALNLPDVGFSQEEHTDTGLADAAADGVGQLFFNNSLLEGQLRPFRAACFFQLGKQGLFIYTDTHGGQLQSNVQNRIINHDIRIQGPVSYTHLDNKDYKYFP